MEARIDYSKYSYADLLSAREGIDVQASPENTRQLDDLIAAHPDNPANSSEASPQGRPCEITFSGKSKEFFSIWVVNLFLSIVTLGVYSAWAKVRTNRYFYGHLSVDGHRFSYLAEPIQILKGRIIAVLLFGGYFLSSIISPAVSIVFAIALVFAMPLLICKGLLFSMKMTAYRNVRFGFTGTYGEAFLAFLIYPVLTLFTLYLAMPWALKKMDEFIVENTTFGDKKFSTALKNGEYFGAAYAAGFVGIAIFFIGSMVTAGVASVAQEGLLSIGTLIFMLLYVAVYAISSSIYTALIRNHLYQVSKLDDVATFNSDVPVSDLLFLKITNLLAVVATLGFALPWAKIRTARFMVAHTQVYSLGGIDKVVATPQQTASSTAEEVANAFDLDISLG